MNKKLLLMYTATALTLSAFTASADDKKTLPLMDNMPKIEHMERHMPPKPEVMEAKLADKLGLSAEQREKAKIIRKVGHKKVKPLMKEMKELRHKIDKLRHENMEEFEEILTPEQKNKFEELKKEMKNKSHKNHKMRGHRGEHKGFELKYKNKL